MKIKLNLPRPLYGDLYRELTYMLQRRPTDQEIKKAMIHMIGMYVSNMAKENEELRQAVAEGEEREALQADTSGASSTEQPRADTGGDGLDNQTDTPSKD